MPLLESNDNIGAYISASYIPKATLSLNGNTISIPLDATPFPLLQPFGIGFSATGASDVQNGSSVLLIYITHICLKNIAENSNIFVIDEPSTKISQKYQLSDFEDNGRKKSHIIIFPYHKPKKMLELVNDLAKDIRARN